MDMKFGKQVENNFATSIMGAGLDILHANILFLSHCTYQLLILETLSHLLKFLSI